MYVNTGTKIVKTRRSEEHFIYCAFSFCCSPKSKICCQREKLTSTLLPFDYCIFFRRRDASQKSAFQLKNQQPCLFFSRSPTPIIYEPDSHELYEVLRYRYYQSTYDQCVLDFFRIRHESRLTFWYYILFVVYTQIRDFKSKFIRLCGKTKMGKICEYDKTFSSVNLVWEKM